jgi:hypothetical protein
MVLFRPRCPVAPREQAWIEKMLLWCVSRFGELPLHGRVVEPAELLPGTYTGTEQHVLRVVEGVRAHLGISADRFAVEVAVDPDAPGDMGILPVYPVRFTTVAGHYQQRGGKGYIRIDPLQVQEPMRLVAVVAHELCHELLLGGSGVADANGADHEPLTDLLTVYTGLGIFGANAAFEFAAFNAGGWRTRSLGYMNESMFGYALACYAWLRGESDPAWARFLDTNPRGYLKEGSKYLAANVGSTALARFRSAGGG